MSNYIEEEITLVDFADRFIGLNNLSEPNEFDIEPLGIEVLTLDSNGEEVYKPIQSFVVKEMVDSYYTDGKIKVSGNHRFIENGSTVFAKDHPEFNKICGDMHVVDIEVADLHSYLANGRLNHNTTSGGKALAFHCSIRIRLKMMGQLKVGDRIVGIKVRAQLIKNRIGPPLRNADFDIYFDRGIDNYGSWLRIMKDNKFVKQNGAWYEYIDTDTGEIHKFQSKDFIKLLDGDANLKDQVYRKMCEATILQYKDNTVPMDAMELTNSTNESD
jgi:hypothetical protein